MRCVRGSRPFGRLVAVAAALVATATAAACTDDKPTDNTPATASPSPSGWTSPLTDEQAFGKIPLDGTSGTPLKWQLPAPSDPETDEIVLAARRFRALDFYDVAETAANPETPYLYRHVATDRMVDKVLYPDGYPSPKPDPDPSEGTVWLWVIGVDKASPTEATVNMCLDLGWWHKHSEPANIHQINRAQLESFTVKKVGENDAAPRWKVDRHINNAIDDLGPRYGAQCTAWAKHTP